MARSRVLFLCSEMTEPELCEFIHYWWASVFVKREWTTFCCNASHIFLEDNTIGYTTKCSLDRKWTTKSHPAYLRVKLTYAGLASTVSGGIHDHEKRLKLWWTCIIMEMRRRWTLKILRCTMDGSKVYGVAAKDRKKKRHANKTWKRQKQDMQKMNRNGKHELHSTLDVQRNLFVHVWIGCCIANGYSHPINRHVIPNCRKYWHIASFVCFCLDHTMLHASKTLQDPRSQGPGLP